MGNALHILTCKNSQDLQSKFNIRVCVCEHVPTIEFFKDIYILVSAQLLAILGCLFNIDYIANIAIPRLQGSV